MIDIHCHLLPGIDDGPKNMEESLELSRLFVRAGYRHVITTPHWVFGTSWVPSPKTISEEVAKLNQKIKDEGINLTAHIGMEVALDNKIPELLGSHEIIGLAGKSYMLVEAPFLRLPLGWEEIFFSILSKGYKIIVGHPERCAHLAEKNGIIDEFIRAGLYLQVNWSSFLGYYGTEAAQMANYMAANGYIHCLATDSHDLRNRHPGHVKKAMNLVEKLVGTSNLNLLAKENPVRVLKGDPLVPMSRMDLHGKAPRTQGWVSKVFKRISPSPNPSRQGRGI